MYQLTEQYKEPGDGEPRSYPTTKKAHATLFQERFQPLYLEHLSFLINRAGWQVTKLNLHYSFEQERFKRNLILMNQRSRQNTKNSIEKDFYKLMNNANFGYDCRNNLDNCQFIPIFDEMNEVTYLKRYYNYFDKEVSKFVSTDLIRAEVEEKYNDSLMKLSKDDKFYQIKLIALKTEKQEGLEAVEAFEKKNKKLKRKRTIADYMTRREEVHKNNKIKSLIDFDEANTNSIKSLAVEKKSNIKLTTRFMKGKMLMFAKTSLQSFVYDMIDVFCFPDHAVQEIYKKYQIEKCYMYQNLTDTDSTLLFFIFICDNGCVVS